MINIIDKLDDFLNEREDKEKYMIYLSIVIVIGMIYYFFNWNMLHKEIIERKSTLKSIEKSYDIKSYENKLRISKNKFTVLNNKISSLEKNIQEIQKLITSIKSVKLFVDDNDLFMFLQNVFSLSIKKSLFPSYTIDKKKSDLLTHYQIKIKGKTTLNNFINFIHILRFVEKSDYIVNLNRVEFNVSNYSYGTVSDFNSTINIWSYK